MIVRDRHPGRSAQDSILHRLVRFSAVGALGTLAHFVTLVLLVETGAAGPVASTVAGSAVGAALNYLLNRRYTFRSERAHRDAGPRFALVALATGILNAMLVHLGTGLLELHYLLAQICVTLITLLANYGLNARWTFYQENGA